MLYQRDWIEKITHSSILETPRGKETLPILYTVTGNIWEWDWGNLWLSDNKEVISWCLEIWKLAINLISDGTASPTKSY